MCDGNTSSPTARESGTSSLITGCSSTTCTHDTRTRRNERSELRQQFRAFNYSRRSANRSIADATRTSCSTGASAIKPRALQPCEWRRVGLKPLVWKLWDDSKAAFGARRIRAKLAQTGEVVSVWLVAKLMRELGIAGVQPSASKRATIPADDAKTRRDLRHQP
ncbi:IS3 family transposase [Klugiella xanthotipulae]